MTQALSLNTTSSFSRAKEAYLNLQLDAQTQILLPMTQTQEVVEVNLEKLTPIPNMPPFVLGLLNQRSQVIWTIDLAAFLNFNPLNLEQTSYTVTIIRVGKTALGLITEKMKGIVHAYPEQIQSPVGAVSSAIVPYLRGCLFQPPETLFLILDPQSILSMNRYQ